MRIGRALTWTVSILAMTVALASPIVAQVNPHPGRTLPKPISAPTFEPAPVPTLPSAPGLRNFQRGILGPAVPLSRFPHLPPKPPLAFGGLRHVLAANGATMNVSVDPLFNGSCSTTVGGIYDTGCDVGIASSSLPTTHAYQDYYIDANASTATSVGGTYNGANSDPGQTITLSHAGTYVLAAYDTVNGTWDAVTYIDVGGGTTFSTYSDPSHNVPSTQFTALNSSNVYVHAAGLTPTDLYELYVEFTSYKATCVYESPLESPAPAANTLCNPANSAGQNAAGGVLDVTWPLSTTYAAGTYSIVIYDKTSSKRIAQRQVVIVKNGGSTAISLTPSGGNASPNPAPAGTPSTTFAFDGSTDSSDSGYTASASGLTNNRTYTAAVSDPEGHVTTFASLAATSTGTLSVAYTMGQARSPGNYVGNTYTFGLLDSVSGLMAATQSYKILGYNVLTQFTSPLGTSLILSSGASTTSGLQFTNNSATTFGAGNGDAIREIEWDTYSNGNQNGVTITLGSSSSSCGTSCQTQTVTDTNSQSWTATNQCGGSGSNTYCKLTLVPVTSTNALAVGASVSVPSIQFYNAVGSHCSSNCTASTFELPADGLTWSNEGVSNSSNPVYFTNGFGTTYSATSHLTLYGERAGNSGTLTVGKEAHGYTPRFNQAMYAASQPFSSPTGQSDVFALTFTNTSSGGSVSEVMVTFPTAFSPSSSTNFVQVDPSSPTTWAVTACPSGSPGAAFCMIKSGSNAGIAAGTAQTIYFDINPPPANAFSYSATSVQSVSPQAFSAAADGTVFPFVPSTSSVDTLAIASYSLDSTLITPLFAPTSEGTSTNNQVTISVQNASTGSSPYPDYLDLFAIDVPTANPLTNIANVSTGFSYLGSTTAGSNTRYWFGLCTNQFTTIVNPPNDGVVSCGSTTEQNALAPGATFSFTAKIQTGSSAGTITATEYAHGANGGGWSNARAFSLTVTPVSAVAGFTYAGAYSASPVANLTSPTQPTVGADSDPTYGSSFIYEIKSTGSQAVTSATITIPGTTTGGNNGADNGNPNTNWTITAAPTLSGSGSAGCTVASYTSADTSGNPGSISITGCNIGPSQVLDVKVSMKSPYDVNSTFKFSTVVNSSINASEAWFADTQLKIVLSGQIVVTVDPSSPGPGGSTPSIVCPSCAFDTTLNEIQFRNIPNNTSDNYVDPMRVSFYTNAGTSNTWNLTVATNNNPTNSTGAPAKELEMGVDAANSHLPASVTVDQSSLAVVPTSGSLQLVHVASGNNPQRAPFDILEDFTIAIGGEAITPQTSVLTFTYIAN
ncbi:MAG: hypothetical protein ABR584_03920 [Candidatus Baltobacteraceae bacterium]